MQESIVLILGKTGLLTPPEESAGSIQDQVVCSPFST